MNSNDGLQGRRKQNAYIVRETFSSKDNKIVLLVEGPNDKSFIERFIPEEKRKNILVLGIKDYRTGKVNNLRLKNSVSKELKEFGKSDTDYFKSYEKQFIVGGCGEVEGKIALILTIKKQWAKEKKYDKRGYIDFYGIVDKDYDETEKDVYQAGKLKEVTSLSTQDLKYFIHNVDIISEGKLISTDSNDVETMFFKYDKDTISNICKDYFPKESFLKNLSFSINCACKLGYIRKENKTKNLSLNLSDLFPKKQPARYEKYLKDTEINIKKILEDIQKGNKDGINLGKMPADFSDKEWIYCRGHDLMGILACVCVMRTAVEEGNGVFCCNGKHAERAQVIFDIEKALSDDIIKNTVLNRYKNSKVSIFLKRILSKI